MGKTCSFTGHRNKIVPWLNVKGNPLNNVLYDIIREKVIQKIHEGYDYFISGMALGADMLCAHVVLDLREIYPKIKLECALPCREQAEHWSLEQQEDYEDILNKSDNVHLVCKQYSRACMHIRNKYLADKADCLIAIWNGSAGGTKNTIALAKRKGIPIEIINPDDCVEN